MASKRRLEYINPELEKLRLDGLYRELRYGRVTGSRIVIGDDNLLNLCSNDYLGIPVTGITTGQMQSSSRLVSGNDELYRKLEDGLARHKLQDAGLVYPTGYMANTGTIPAIARKGDLILSDELNHASLIEACRLSGARIMVYKHNDTDDLAQKLKKDAKNKFVITEGVFSMDGDHSPLKQITEIAQKAQAVTVLDDAHGDFVMGADGMGTAESQGVAKDIDVYISSLSKGLGSFGGYAVSQDNVINLCVNRSKSFIYTSALPSFLVEHALERFGSDRERYKERLERNVVQMSAGLKQIGFEIKSASQIIPVMVGDEKKAVEFGQFLFENKVFVQPIRYPTVARNQARLRVSMTAWPTSSEIETALEVFERAYHRFGGQL